MDKYIYLPLELSPVIARRWIARWYFYCDLRKDDVVTNDGEEADVVNEKSFRVRRVSYVLYEWQGRESQDGRCRHVYKRKSNQRETGEGNIESALRVCDRASWIIHRGKNTRSSISYRNDIFDLAADIDIVS